MIHRSRRLSRAVLALGAALTVACGPQGPEQSTAGGQAANGSGPPEPRISAFNTSDAHAYVFPGTFPRLFVYTSSDMNIDPVTYPDGRRNLFPMDTTYVHWLSPGSSPSVPGNWNEQAALRESDLTAADGRFVAGTDHLWGPDAAKGEDGSFYLYVPDILSQETDSSRIAVFRSRAPTGPFNDFVGMVTFDGVEGGPFGYASDPNVVGAAGRVYSRYFVFANGDFDTPGIACGGISIGSLASDMRSVTNVHEIHIDKIPLIKDRESACYKRYLNRSWNQDPQPRPYIESPALYYLTPTKDGVASGDRPWYLFFPVNLDNGWQSLAYARASDPMGDFEYQGVILPPGNEWTTHGSIVKWGEDWLLFYHEKDARADGLGRDRMVHATCIGFDAAGNVKGVAASGALTSLPLARDPTGYGISCSKKWAVPLGVVMAGTTEASVSLQVGLQQFTCATSNTKCNWNLGNKQTYSLTGSCGVWGSFSGCDEGQGGGCRITMNKPRNITYTCSR